MMIMCAYLATFAGERAKVEAGSWLAAHFTQLVHLHQNKSKRRASLIKINHFGQKIKHTHIYSSSVLYIMVVAPQTRPAARSFFISLSFSLLFFRPPFIMERRNCTVGSPFRSYLFVSCRVSLSSKPII